MRAMTFVAANEPLVAEDRTTPTPGPGDVRIRVEACGVCHSDHFIGQALWPDLELPRVPGHEVVGTVDALGDGVTQYAAGDRVGLGWHGGHDGTCSRCMSGKFIHCDNAAVTGISRDGGYAEYAIAPAVALARVPAEMDAKLAAPLLCAGVTTYNALRNADARPGDLVAIQGLGGLGHLGVQFARAMGFEVAAVSRGSDKASFAHELGAHHYIDAKAGDPAAALTERGGAKVILATAPHAPSISGLVGGLGVEGSLIVVGAPFEPLQIGAVDLISRDASVRGWSSGTGSDSTDCLRFAHEQGVKAMIEPYPLANAQAAYDRMMSGDARFRVVLDVAS
ncbi:MAG: alcohol dehydrogenase catalytic domain-containing protein [Planctomycetota bacterium]